MSEQSKWALRTGALERPFGPICAILVLFALWRLMEVPTILDNISNNERNQTDSLQVIAHDSWVAKLPVIFQVSVPPRFF